VEVLAFIGPGEDLRFDHAKTLKNFSGARTSFGISSAAFNGQRQEIRRAARTGQLVNLSWVDSECRGIALEMVIVRQPARRNLAKNDAEGENVGGEVEFVAN